MVHCSYCAGSVNKFNDAKSDCFASFLINTHNNVLYRAARLHQMPYLGFIGCESKVANIHPARAGRHLVEVCIGLIAFLISKVWFGQIRRILKEAGHYSSARGNGKRFSTVSSDAQSGSIDLAPPMQ